MAKKSSNTTPSRSSGRAGKQTDLFQVVHEAKKRHSKRRKNSESDSKSRKSHKKLAPVNNHSFVKVVDHRLFNTHYVEYQVLLTNGKKIMATEFEFKGKKNLGLLSAYKFKITNQEDNVDEDFAVEKIITHRYVKDNAKPLYLVMWRGFPNPVSHSELWENELENCKELVEAYKASHDMKPPTTKKNKKKGGKKPTSKKQQTADSDESSSDDDDDDEEKEKSFKTKSPKKRAASDDEDDEDESISRKKSKKVMRSEVADDDEEEDEEPKISKKSSKSAPKKSKKDIRKSPESDNDDNDDQDDNSDNNSGSERDEDDEKDGLSTSNGNKKSKN